MNSAPPVAFSFLGWIALMGGIWFLFEKTESAASHDTKRRVTRWLEGAEPHILTSWPATFTSVFDHVFGDRHLTVRCFGRSALASLLFTVILVSTDLENILPHIDRFQQFHVVILLAYALVMNMVLDYFALLETRWVLSLMTRSRNVIVLASLVVFDLVLTGILSIAGNGAIWKATERVLLPSQPTFDQLVAFIRFMLPIPFEVWLVAPFLTSIWLWLYLASGIAIAAMRAMSGALRLAMMPLDIKQKPITSIGWVAMFIASIVYWMLATVPV